MEKKGIFFLLLTENGVACMSRKVFFFHWKDVKHITPYWDKYDQKLKDSIIC